MTFADATQAATTATFTATGVYVLRLTASDSQLTASDEAQVTVFEPITGPPPSVTINSPSDGAQITSITPVRATVSGGSWRLEYSPESPESLESPGSQGWITLATGSGAVTNSAIAQFDPTMLLNGIYSLRLRSIDASGQEDSDTIALVVNGNLKIGNFTLSFSDLNVPVAGIPIEVIRTYDSRDKRVGDFGVGWQLGLRDIRLQKSVVLGRHWQETFTGGIIPKWCLETTRAHIITITFPDGRVYKFRMTTSPQCQNVDALRFTTVGYELVPGLTGTAGATLRALANNDVIVDGGVPGLVTLVTGSGLYNPTLFELKTAEGMTFVIDQHEGLKSLTDLNGNTLTVNSNGIIHSSGKSIVFTRDSQGRITQITDPSGNAMTYGYDSAGDLVNFTDRENNVTTFGYNSTHGLLTINDPRGIQPIRNDYDANGRLISHTDAFGKTILYDHLISASQERITDRLGHSSLYEYDNNGNVLRMTDALGNVTTYTYDARDNKTSETNAVGKTRSYTFDGADNLLTETDPLGNTMSYTYNSRRQVLTATDARGAVTTNTYEPVRGNLTSSTDALGRTTSYAYNSQGLMVTMTDALGHVTRMEYNPDGYMLKQTDANGHETFFTYIPNGSPLTQTTTRTIAGGATETLVTRMEYDKLDRLTRTIYADGSTTQMIYNSIGQQAATIDQLGRQTSFEYDSMGRLVKSTYPDSTFEESTYDAEGRRLTSKDRAGRVTSFVYDALGRLTSMTYPDGTTTSTVYDAIGRVESTRDARGNTTRFEYDSNCGCSGRRAKITDALGQITTFTYDANGNQASMTDARGNVMSYEYDALNRRVKMIYADGTFDQTGYDAIGRNTSRTDQAGKTTRFEYDDLSRLVKVIDALNQETRYSYDELGNQLTQTDALNRTTRFEYDKLGRRVKRTLPLGQSETYSYNAAGNLTSRTDFNSKTTAYSYDVMNRLLSRVPDASLSQPAISFTYTQTGRRATMSDASGSTVYGYDNRDRLTSKATPQGTLNYSYDAAGNLLSTRSSNVNGVNVSYSYDALNRLSTAEGIGKDARPATGSTSYSYDAVGNLSGYLYPNGVQSSYSYNSLNRLTSMSVNKNSSTLTSYTYTLGAAGNRVSVVEANGRRVNYSYDDLYRLTAETITSDPVTANNGSISYGYDAVGNRLSRNSSIAAVPSTTHSFDANDRLTTDSYDNNGNTISSAGNSYSFDFENRLTSLNNGQVSIIYDGDGNRVSKTVGGVTTRYLVDDLNPTGYAQVVEEIVSGDVKRVYVYGNDLISQQQVVSGNWSASFYGYDGHGSVRMLTDASGAVTDAYTYDAFGILIHQAGTTANDYLYAGEQRDPSLGLDYLRARYMNPATGRFWSMDRFEGSRVEPVSLHKYLYAKANPVNLKDPTGLQGVTVQEATATLSIASILVNIIGVGVGQCIINRLFPLPSLPVPGEPLIPDDDDGPIGPVNPCKSDDDGQRTYYHYSTYPYSRFVGGLDPGSAATDESGLSSYNAGQGLGIPYPLYEYPVTVNLKITKVIYGGRVAYSNRFFGGLKEYFFPDGTPPGSVGFPKDVPQTHEGME